MTPTHTPTALLALTKHTWPIKLTPSVTTRPSAPLTLILIRFTLNHIMICSTQKQWQVWLYSIPAIAVTMLPSSSNTHAWFHHSSKRTENYMVSSSVASLFSSTSTCWFTWITLNASKWTSLLNLMLTPLQLEITPCALIWKKKLTKKDSVIIMLIKQTQCARMPNSNSMFKTSWKRESMRWTISDLERKNSKMIQLR